MAVIEATRVTEIALAPPEEATPIAERDMIYQVLVDDGSGEGFTRRGQYAYLALLNGQVTLGEMPIAAPCFDTEEVCWYQETSNHYSTGQLIFLENGLSFHGTVVVGTSEEETETLAVVGHASRATVYDTKITKGKYDPKTKPSDVPQDQWATGRLIEIGYETILGDPDITPNPSFRCQDKNGTWHKMPEWQQGIEGNYFVLTVKTTEDECTFLDDPDFYSTGELRFKADEPWPTGYGYISTTCGAPTPEKQVRLWTATPRRTNRDGEDAAPISLPTVDREEFFGGEEVLTAPRDLKLAELYQLLPTDDMVDGKKGATDLLNSPLERNMRWAMGQQQPDKDWLEKLMGRGAPTLSDDELKLAQAGADWYREWGKAYLTKSFNEYRGTGQSEVFLSDKQAKKLANYFKTGITKHPKFNVQYQGLYVETYLASKPRLREYIKDGGPKWAKALYEDATTSSQYIMLVNSYANPSTRDNALRMIKKMGTVMLALEPAGTHANKYFEAVTTGVVAKMLPSVGHYDADLANSWIPDVVTALLKQIADGKDPGTSGITKTEAQEMLNWFRQNSTAFSADLAAFMANLKASGLLDLAKKAEEGYAGNIAGKYPKMGKFASLMFVAGWLGGLYSVMLSLTTGDWKKLTDKQRAEVLAQCVSTGLDAFKAAKEVWGGIKKITLQVWSKLSKWFSAAPVKDALSKIAQRLTGAVKWLTKAGELFKKILGAGGNIGKGTIFAKIFSQGLMSAMAKLVGVAVSVALTVLALIDLIECIKNNGTVTDTVLAALAFAAALVGTVLLVASMLLSSVVIPIIGWVVALIGVVIAVVKWFTSKPANPVTDFMRQYGIPFADSLPEPNAQSDALPSVTDRGTLLVASA